MTQHIHNPESSREDHGNHEIGANAPEHLRHEHGEKVHHLIPQSAEGEGYRKAVDHDHGDHRSVRRERDGEVNDDARSQMQDKLRDIEERAAELLQIGLEHRVEDIRDVLPIFANIRSHTLAGREAEIIDALRLDTAELQQMAGQAGIFVDMKGLTESVAKLGKPEGVSKWMATLFLTRSFHRGYIAPRLEEIKREASVLRRTLRDAGKGSRRAA